MVWCGPSPSRCVAKRAELQARVEASAQPRRIPGAAAPAAPAQTSMVPQQLPPLPSGKVSANARLVHPANVEQSLEEARCAMSHYRAIQKVGGAIRY